MLFTRLAPWQQSPEADPQKKALQMEADYYLGSGNVNGFVRVTDAELKGRLKDDDMLLSFIARRSQYEGGKNKRIPEQAYKMAKRAVEINPEEYSHQSTFYRR